MFFKFHEEASVSGIDGYKYTLAEGFMANATYNASNECYNPHPDLGNYLKNSRQASRYFRQQGGSLGHLILQSTLNAKSQSVLTKPNTCLVFNYVKPC